MSSTSKPHILLFFTDQQRADTCGCYGQTLETTPNLDRLAGEGVRFSRAFTCQPVCGPARACIQTGKYATELGAWRNGKPLPRDEQTLAHRLAEVGYETAYVGKWHLASDDAAGVRYHEAPVPPERRGGYDHWIAADVLEHVSHSYDGHMWDADGNRRDFPEGRYRADAVTDFALEVLDQRSPDRPLLMMISYIEPHHQNDHDRYEGPAGSADRFARFPVPGDLLDTEGNWRENYPDYLGCVNALDANLGRLVDALKDRGMWDDTILLFFSDHGSHFRTRNSEYKRSCHDASLHIPMVARGGPFAGGRTADQLVSLLDVAPTVLRAAGADEPSTLRGRALQELTADPPPADWRKEVFVQVSEDHIGRALRTERWTYEVVGEADQPRSGTRKPSADEYVEWHLYDNHADPHQRRNLAADPDYAGVRAELRRTLRAYLRDVEGAEPAIVPAAGGAG
jgi:uncharacterized sulfatase